MVVVHYVARFAVLNLLLVTMLHHINVNTTIEERSSRQYMLNVKQVVKSVLLHLTDDPCAIFGIAFLVATHNINTGTALNFKFLYYTNPTI